MKKEREEFTTEVAEGRRGHGEEKAKSEEKRVCDVRS